jgi:hypothetical protein
MLSTWGEQSHAEEGPGSNVSDDQTESNVDLAAELRHGLTEEQLLSAISESGYPLQSEVVDEIAAALGAVEPSARSIFEEWSFEDPDSGKVRQLDALIQQSLPPEGYVTNNLGIPTDPRELLRFQLDFLVECKRSDLPFVFFLRDQLVVPALPEVVGLPYDYVRFHSGDGEPSASVSCRDVLFGGRMEEPTNALPAISVSRTYRKGKGVELSGEDIFRGLTTPVRKALERYRAASSPVSGQLYHDVRFVFPLVVLDAPMVGCTVREGVPSLAPIRWARLSLSEPGVSSDWTGFNVRSSLDFVHRDHLREYCTLALKRAQTLMERGERVALQLLFGEAMLAEPLDDSVPTNDWVSYLRPTMDSAEAAAWIRKRFIEVHTRPGVGEPEDKQTEV